MRAWPRVIAAPLIVATLLAAACTDPAPSPQRRAGDGLIVFGAASLRNALTRLEPEWESTHPNVPLTIATGSSAALRTQIELGAPVDVFLAADTANPRRLVEGGLAAGDPVAIGVTEIAIVASPRIRGRITEVADLAQPGLKVIAAAPGVPISGYVEEMLRRPGLPPGFAAAYRANIVSHEDDAAAVLAKIELGEGDAAIVYYTDAVASGKVHTISLPRELAVQATYAGVVVKSSGRVEDARAFLDWLTGPVARPILEHMGFSRPGQG